jgi:hypothetical protein
MWKVLQHERRPGMESHCGTVEVGDFGYRSRLMDVDSGKDTFARRPTDAELLPMFFLLNAPAKATRGIVILQKHGIRSSYSFMSQAFRNYFDQAYPDYRLELRSFVAQSTLNAFREGVVRRITLISTRLPEDIATQVKLKIPEGVPVLFEQVIRFPSKRGVKMPDWIARHFRKGTAAAAGIRDLPLGADAAKVTVKGFKGRDRTLELGSAEDMVPYVDVTDEVKVEDGHPVYDSIRAYALNFLTEVAAELRGE